MSYCKEIFRQEETHLNANDVLKYGHSFFVNAFDGLPEADWHTPGVCGVWSVKDIVAHMASYEGMLSSSKRRLHTTPVDMVVT